MKIRVQKRECTGTNRNPYRSVMTWSAWKTVATFGAEQSQAAREYVDACKRRGGLYEFRILQGKAAIV